MQVFVALQNLSRSPVSTTSYRAMSRDNGTEICKNVNSSWVQIFRWQSFPAQYPTLQNVASFSFLPKVFQRFYILILIFSQT